ncbi:MAG: Uma2 family endonuclease [Merismopediaceae bacterium]|nr:Uma2 family endonuclease [Merismopediaceae bacterium]
MVTAFPDLYSDIYYPDSDGLPMAESDVARDYLTYGVEALDTYFQNKGDVYVSGNIFVYYQQGDPKSVISPDVLVSFGVEKKKRKSYKTWEEQGHFPDFVLEITSKSTVHEDQGIKKGLYAHLGAQEYFQYDPTADYLVPALQGYTLVNGNYIPLEAQHHSTYYALSSQVLGLELHYKRDTGEMRFYAPQQQSYLLSYREKEQALQQKEQALQQAEQARLISEQEKQTALAQVERLAAKLRALGLEAD